MIHAGRTFARIYFAMFLLACWTGVSVLVGAGLFRMMLVADLKRRGIL